MKPSLNSVGSFLSPQVSTQPRRRFLPIGTAALTTPKIYYAADYEGDRLQFVVKRLCQTQGFKMRKAQLQEVLTLTHEARYLATAPLLLIVADGVGEDVFQKSIFSEGVNLEELHSLAGHPDALPKLVYQMCRTRRKTTEEYVSFPYRNGILHGRDLGYGNRLITAKCWSFLSNIADVIRAREAKMDDVEMRDAAVQAAESWGGREVVDVLMSHDEPEPWLRECIPEIIDDLRK